jgi:hypothetical protein
MSYRLTLLLLRLLLLLLPGVANKTYGLGGFACRQCPTNMQATQALSAAYSATNGFTDPLACVTKTGYGYNGRIATQCAIDSFNAAGNRMTCTKCPYGTRTNGTAANQGLDTDCGIAEGFGFHNSVIQPCPMGESTTSLGHRQGAVLHSVASFLQHVLMLAHAKLYHPKGRRVSKETLALPAHPISVLSCARAACAVLDSVVAVCLCIDCLCEIQH